MSAEIIHGDCLEAMRGMPDACVDAIITDPPYGLKFMGKDWDHGVPGVPYWTEALRVAKPGSYLLAFGGTRTYHRLACAIEDAGWEVHDCLSWLYGSGFPKHASKLKPAWEPVILARKPAPRATPLNIDATRIRASTSPDGARSNRAGSTACTCSARGDDLSTPCPECTARHIEAQAEALGRWPANVVLDEEAARALDEMSGECGAAAPASGPTHDGPSERTAMAGSFNGMGGRAPAFHSDTGGASRFFYCAKACRSERDAGLADLSLVDAQKLNPGGVGARRAAAGQGLGRNGHPTVKPIALMRWLVRLVTPPGGTVLDPFAGSGTTGCAAVLEGREFVGIEREAEYVEIARRRLAHWQAQYQPSLEVA